MGHPEEERRLLGRDPESMGDEAYHDDPRPPPPTWRDRARKSLPSGSRRTLKMVLLAALVFFTLSGFLSMLATTVVRSPSDKSPSKEPPKSYDPVTGLPIKDGPSQPDEPSSPTEPTEPTRPTQPDQPPDVIHWHPPSTCLQTGYRFDPKIFDLSFTPEKTVSILQTVDTDSPSRGFQPHVSGSFVVRRQHSGVPGPSIQVEVIANDQSLDVGVEWDSNSQQLKVKTPQRIEWNQSLRPCVTLRATIWVPENAQLAALTLTALNLDIQLLDDLAITLENSLEINTLSGDVHSPPSSYRLNSRDIIVRTVSGDIEGSWPLYDSLKIGSDSGDINAAVAPQQVLDSKPRPAVLDVSSISGSVTVREPIDRASQNSKPDTIIPARDYITTVDTKSGGIRAWVAFSSAAVITSISGDIAAEFLPVYNLSLLQSVTEPELHTKTKSGNVAVVVLEPLWVEIAETRDSRDDKPRVNPNEPVDIPTNPVPIPEIPKIPHMPRIPFMPGGAGDPYKHIPGRRWGGGWPIRRSSADASTQTEERAVTSAQNHPPMRHLKSTHGTVSGSMKVRYPASWEGTVTAESVSGNIDVSGKGVVIDQTTKWPRSVHAHKGQAWTCDASLGSVSGDHIFVVGNDNSA